MVYKRESDSNVYIDPATGDLPYLSTTAGIYLYNISLAVPVWKVGRILVDKTYYFGSEPFFDYLEPYSQSVIEYNFDRGFENVKFGSKEYNSCPIKTTDLLGSVLPTVTFLFDPATLATTYRVLAYTVPSTSVALTTYLPFDDAELYTVIAMICEIIDAMDNGRFSEIWARLQTWLNKLTFAVDKDSQTIFSKNYTY
jgi:hypothetical protein